MSTADCTIKCFDDSAPTLSCGLPYAAGKLSVIAAPPDIGGVRLLADIVVDLLWQGGDVAYIVDGDKTDVQDRISKIINSDRVAYSDDGIDQCDIGELMVVECTAAAQIDGALRTIGQGERFSSTVIIDCPSLIEYVCERRSGGKLTSLLCDYVRRHDVAIVAHMQLPSLSPEPQEEIDDFVRKTGVRGFSIDEPAWRANYRFTRVVQTHIDALAVMQRRTVSSSETQEVRDFLGNRVLQISTRLGHECFTPINIQADELSYPLSDGLFSTCSGNT